LAARLSTHTAASSRATHAWRTGTFTTSTGEQVRVEVSDAYGPDAVSGQSWADFFAGLVHGPELAALTARIAPPAEVAAVCGDQALGCYSGGLLVIPGEPFGGVAPEEIARHEYGHHVAASRLNPPWAAFSWGPKRWSTAARICARTSAGTAFPNDYSHYALAPGEAFAEAYRVLNDRRAGILSLTWSIVDDSFLPDDATLAAVEADVTTPWLAPAVTVFQGRFAGGNRRWLRSLETPLDGVLSVALTLPRGRTDRLELLDESGRVLARGLWSGSATQRLSYTVCGQRRVSLRLTLGGTAGRFDLRVTRP
jgi:hypothetical protein